jgi:hygromycin-B 7''-O-kinase
MYRDVNVWLPAMHEICQRHDLDATQLEFAPPGTHVIFRVRDLYIKLFSPLWGEDFVREQLVLRKLSDQTESTIPRLVVEGEIEGWSYIIMTAVEGVPLKEVWSSMRTSDREYIAACCGRLIAWLHTTQTEGLEGIAMDWSTFVEGQVHSSINRVTQAEMDEQLRSSILEFLNDLPPLFEPEFQPVLLNADVTNEHVLVSRRDGQWELTGFIDFGDAMLGHLCYEFVAPGCTITRGASGLQRAMLLAYGYSEDELNATLADQLMGYTLLHRYVRISDLSKLFDSKQPRSLEDIKRGLWSFG